MAILKSKGTALLIDISSTYTALTQLLSISVSGQKSEIFDTTVLDASDVVKTSAPTGFTTAAAVSAEVFYDPDDTVQAYIEGLIASPAANNIKITHTDTTPTEVIYSASGFGQDINVSPADGVKATYSFDTSGDLS